MACASKAAAAIDTTTASGKLMLGIFAALAELQVIWTNGSAARTQAAACRDPEMPPS